MKLWLVKHTKRKIALAGLFLMSSFLSLFAEEIDPTDISYVSVNPYTNEVTISWYKSESANIAYARILYIYDETTLIKGKGFVDIAGNEDVTYKFKTDTIDKFSYNPDERVLSLAVDAYSENGNNSTSLREYHTTMLASAQITRCPSQIKLSWTPYYGYGITVSKYEIIEVDAQNNETKLQECAGTEKSCVIELNEQKERRFYVKATFMDCHGKQQSSTSTMCYVSEKQANLPQFISIENISLEQTDITLDVRFDTAADYNTYVLYKSYNDEKHFQPFDTVTIALHKTPLYTFVDQMAFTNDSPVFYKVKGYDKCNTEIIESQSVTPIIASVREISEMQNMIEWTQNAPWEVLQYRIWKNENESDAQLIDSVGNQQFMYLDDLDDSYARCFSLCYKIEAIQNNEEKTVRSFSNKVCLTKEYKLLIPNAFNPNSSITENTTFKPKYAFLFGDYKMEIFDRFGTCVFTSTDIDTGWNGQIKGTNAPVGMYQYRITIQLPNGEMVERHGTVQLVFH